MNQEQTFFFYDLETSGLNPRTDRLMQFAGQRTDLDLNPIGDPVNVLVKLSDDTLPSPGAIMVTKITPQSTQMDGFTEAEFCKYVMDEIFTPGTIATGYNSTRFDDEFMRHTLWRNFYDAYEWQWRDGRSHWDLLDVVRMTRALRPEGINWPVTEEGKATNRLELITKANGISHEHAHDAMSDVDALIDVTRLIKTQQPKLYDFLFKLREKKAVQQLVNLENPKPFVYSSGRYSSKNQKTTVAFPVAPLPNQSVLVFDLRYNLDEVLAERTAEQAQSNPSLFPILKPLRYNKCPAVSPLGVLGQGDGWQKIDLTQAQVEQNLQILNNHPEIIEQAREHYENRPEFPPAEDSEAALYDGFLDHDDARNCEVIRNMKKTELVNHHPEFHDPRLDDLLLHYKARNFDGILSDTEQAQWEAYRAARLQKSAPKYLEELQKLAESGADSFILEELQLWYQSILPY